MLEQVIRQLADSLAHQVSHKIPFELVIKPELPPDNKGRDTIILIKAGNPPLICISRIYLVACVSSAQIAGMHGLKDTLKWAIEKLPRMQHTLSLQPVSEALALRMEAKKWIKTNAPFLRTELPKHQLKITNIAIELSDVVSGTKVMRNGTDYNDILHRCIHDLSKLVIADEEMDDWREKILDIERCKKLEVKPNEIHVTIGDGITEIKMEY